MPRPRVKASTKYHKKRHGFCKKKETSANDDIQENVEIDDIDSSSANISISSKKIEDINVPNDKKHITGYRIVDMDILVNVFKLLQCPLCNHQNINLSECHAKKKGLASLLYIECSCGFYHEFYSSQKIGHNSYDVNKRMVYSMRATGQGYAGIEKFTMLMNMPMPMTNNNYDKIVGVIATNIKSVAEETMSEACVDIRNNFLPDVNDDVIVNTAILCDGSWHRRGYSSINGVVTIISMDSGKILDCEPMSRYCKGCYLHSNLAITDPAAYKTWKDSHICKINHKGSASAMEVTGTKRIFERSIIRNKLRYSQFYGDGDCKSYASVKDTYEGTPVQKLECVGHVQKRVGSRLRNLKKNNKGLGGKGKLTNASIDRLQNYYGMSIRQNTNNLEAMQKAIHASLFHVASSSTNIWHDHCPKGVDSWCRYQQDLVTGNSTYKPGAGLPLIVIKVIKPIYNELSSDALLSKCLHGLTQNQNESFNGTIWERLPKTKYYSMTQLEFGVYDAVAYFNIGAKACILLYEKLKMLPGHLKGLC